MVWNRVDLAEEKIFVHGNQSLGKDFFSTWLEEISRVIEKLNG